MGDRMTLFGKEEKKVEYLELVYDLIFVYIVGRNNALMHNFENGFTTLGSFSAYVFCTLAIIQIWMFSTFYINLYGRNSVRDYVFFVHEYVPAVPYVHGYFDELDGEQLPVLYSLGADFD